MSVKTLHPDYQLFSPKWRLVRDAVEGEHAVKRAPNRYLPEFVPQDTERYRRYVERAYFMGVTGRTRSALSGMVFRRDPMIAAPDEMYGIMENADGSGSSLMQLAKEGLGGVLDTGRHIYLVDYPSIDDSIDFETEQNIGARPLILSYHAESLINWRYEKLNGRRVLTLAVLVELVHDEKNEFQHDLVKKKVELVQPEERGLLFRLKEAKEQEMIGIGARIVQRGGPNETAEAARINASAEASALDQVVNNMSDGLTEALKDAAMFAGVDGSGIFYRLNTRFWEEELDSQEMMALIQLGDVGVISRRAQRESIRKGRVHIPEDMTDEDIENDNAGNPII